ncbi:MAG: 50S ribosomal protein L19 [Candidatus Andersenbacteria bacterium]
MEGSTNTKSLESLVASVEAGQLRADLPEVRPGATVAVHQRILEKGKVRIQIFEGLVLKSVRRGKLGASILVRKVANGIGVERTFFMHSPLIEKVEIKKQAKVRRAKLYYMRGLAGRAAVHRDQEIKKATAATPTSAKPAAAKL